MVECGRTKLFCEVFGIELASGVNTLEIWLTASFRDVVNVGGIIH